MSNTKLTSAKKAKNDEFYTRLVDIEDEMKHYRKHFRDKVIFLNCDDPEESMFWKFFELNFDFFGLKKLIATHYDREEPTYKLEITRGVDLNGDGEHNHSDIITTPLLQNGDFRSPECIELLKEADIVITNPPFSLFREYLGQLVEHNKDFIIIGNKNAITYKEVFPLIQQNKMWLGMRPVNKDMWFTVPEGDKYEKIIDGQKMKHIMACWFTTLDIPKRHEEMILFKNYDPDSNPHYDNYDAINVDKVDHIPCDYEESWGIPLGIDLDEKQWKVLYEGKSPDKQKRQWVVPADGTVLADLFVKRADGYVDTITQALEEAVEAVLYRNGCMGVPITYIDKYNPEQTEILDANDIRNKDVREKATMLIKDAEATITEEIASEETAHTHTHTHTHTDNLRTPHHQKTVIYRNGIMGVPITFVDKMNPKQFVLTGMATSHGKEPRNIPDEAPFMNGKWLFKRLLVRRRPYFTGTD